MFIRPSFGHIQNLGTDAVVAVYNSAPAMSKQYNYCDVGVIQANSYSVGVTGEHLQNAIDLSIPFNMIIRAQPIPKKPYNGQALMNVDDVRSVLNITA